MNNIRFIPLTQPETGLINWSAVAPPSLLNLCVRIDFIEDIDEELLMKAVKLTVERLPYCRYRVHAMDDGSFCQYEAGMEEQNACEFYDFSDYSERKLSKLLSKWAGEPFPNKILDTQLYRFRLMRLADNKHCFFLCGHHMIMDIYAVLFAGVYMVKVYDALLHNTELPAVGADPEPVARKQIDFAASDKLLKQEQWYRDINPTEPQFTSLNGVGHKEFIKGKKYGRDRGITQMRSKEIEHRIPKQLVDDVNRMAMEKNVSPYVFYIASLRSYLSKVNNTDDVLFMSLTTNRATLAEKSSGLVRAVGVAFRSIISDSLSFGECLDKLNILHRDYLKRMGLSDPDPCTFIERYYEVPQGMRYTSIMFSYAPFIDFSQIPLKIKAAKIDSGISLAPLYILLTQTDASGDMSAFYQYATGYIKPENVDKYHAFMLRFLEAGVKDPDKTIAQLTEESL